MNKKEDKTLKNRYFEAILYPDDPNYNTYMQNIKKLYYEVTYVNHDRDIDENGDLKKVHTHILFKVGENARHKNAVSKEIGIPPNYITGVNKKAMLMYLIHLNNPEKTQYSTDEVNGELKRELEKIIVKKIDIEEKLKALIEIIKIENIINYEQLILKSIQYHLTDVLRQNQFLLSKLIEEKQRNFYNVYKKK